MALVLQLATVQPTNSQDLNGLLLVIDEADLTCLLLVAIKR